MFSHSSWVTRRSPRRASPGFYRRHESPSASSPVSASSAPSRRLPEGMRLSAEDPPSDHPRDRLALIAGCWCEPCATGSVTERVRSHLGLRTGSGPVSLTPPVLERPLAQKTGTLGARLITPRVACTVPSLVARPSCHTGCKKEERTKSSPSSLEHRDDFLTSSPASSPCLASSNRSTWLVTPSYVVSPRRQSDPIPSIARCQEKESHRPLDRLDSLPRWAFLVR